MSLLILVLLLCIGGVYSLNAVDHHVEVHFKYSEKLRVPCSIMFEGSGVEDAQYEIVANEAEHWLSLRGDHLVGTSPLFESQEFIIILQASSHNETAVSNRLVLHELAGSLLRKCLTWYFSFGFVMFICCSAVPRLTIVFYRTFFFSLLAEHGILVSKFESERRVYSLPNYTVLQHRIEQLHTMAEQCDYTVIMRVLNEAYAYLLNHPNISFTKTSNSFRLVASLLSSIEINLSSTSSPVASLAQCAKVAERILVMILYLDNCRGRPTEIVSRDRILHQINRILAMMQQQEPDTIDEEVKCNLLCCKEALDFMLTSGRTANRHILVDTISDFVHTLAFPLYGIPLFLKLRERIPGRLGVRYWYADLLYLRRLSFYVALHIPSAVERMRDYLDSSFYLNYDWKYSFGRIAVLDDLGVILAHRSHKKNRKLKEQQAEEDILNMLLKGISLTASEQSEFICFGINGYQSRVLAARANRAIENINKMYEGKAPPAKENNPKIRLPLSFRARSHTNKVKALEPVLPSLIELNEEVIPDEGSISRSKLKPSVFQRHHERAKLLADSEELKQGVSEYTQAERYEAKGEHAFALFWYMKSAENENTSAQIRLAKLYEHGCDKMDITKNAVRAMDYYRMAALKGFSYAQYKLGLFFLTGGKNFEVNLVKGRVWLKKAADLGEIKACFILGKMYMFGQYGVKRNFFLAEKYLVKSVSLKHPRAPKLLNQLRGDLQEKQGIEVTEEEHESDKEEEAVECEIALEGDEDEARRYAIIQKEKKIHKPQILHTRKEKLINKMQAPQAITITEEVPGLLSLPSSPKVSNLVASPLQMSPVSDQRKILSSDNNDTSECKDIFHTSDTEFDGISCPTCHKSANNSMLAIDIMEEVNDPHLEEDE